MTDRPPAGAGPKTAMKELLDDLHAEHRELCWFVADLDQSGWATETPAVPWTIKDQIAHLAYFDDQARLSASDPDGFVASVNESLADMDSFEEAWLAKGRAISGPEVLSWWRSANSEMRDALESREAGDRLLWYGPPMSARSFVTARLMETWAHGQDVVDALGLDRPPSSRLRHIAHLGVVTYGWSFANRGLPVPEEKVRFELTGPEGDSWVWNENATQSVTGPALDFCLVVTQRRHPDDVALVTSGEDAAAWVAVAQAFAGPPGSGRHPGQFD